MINTLQDALDQIYQQMLPMCSQLIGVGRLIAGFAALWFIAIRVWRHIANAEPVDIFSLLRPFAIGIAIMLFPYVIAVMNGVLQPTVEGTGQMLGNANAAISTLLTQRENALKTTLPYQMYVGSNGWGDLQGWELYTGTENMDAFGQIGNLVAFELSKGWYELKNSIREAMSEVLQVIYEAAALCINTMRTFQLLVLAILGPLVLGLSVFDGFQHTFRVWAARYINVFLWLPVANIFGSILATAQTIMIQKDINQIQAGGTAYFGATDAAYLVFMIIGIFGYFTVPSVANYIVSVGGSGPLVAKTTAFFGGIGRRMAGGARNIASAPVQIAKGFIAAGRRKGGNSWRSNQKKK